MLRKEAVAYLKEILSSGETISPDSVTLEQMDCERYQVHIKGIAHQRIVREIAQKLNFEVKEEKGEIIVYKPASAKVSNLP